MTTRSIDDSASWASETFGQVDLRDARRNRRLLSIAAELARSPAGSVMATIQGAAAREGAFRFLASQKFGVDELSDGICRSTLSRCSGLVYCPVDGASISLSDGARSRDIGGVGPWRHGGRGLHAITMMAADDHGAPIGILGPKWWARTERSTAKRSRSYRSLETETQHVVAALERAEDARIAAGVRAQLWFQLDRGFDAWPVFDIAQELRLLITVRATADRKVLHNGASGYLFSVAQSAPELGAFAVRVSERPERPERVAVLSVRVAQVELILQVGSSRTVRVPVSVVYANECNFTGDEPISWMLLTTAEVTDFISACAVILGYTTRWLIEDLHRAWKRGWTNIERTQLRRRNSLCKWATLHFALAARALRLTRLARTEPERESRKEFSGEELHAILLLNTRARRSGFTDLPRLADAVLMLAEIGGYDRYSRKPPGATVIGRGLTRIAPLAAGLLILRENKK